MLHRVYAMGDKMQNEELVWCAWFFFTVKFNLTWSIITSSICTWPGSEHFDITKTFADEGSLLQALASRKTPICFLWCCLEGVKGVSCFRAMSSDLQLTHTIIFNRKKRGMIHHALFSLPQCACLWRLRISVKVSSVG